MQNARSLRRSIFLALSLLSACAAADIGANSGGQSDAGDPEPSGIYGDYLAGRFALSRDDLDTAATRLLQALADDPTNRLLLQQTFIATLTGGRPEASRLAAQLPDSPAAQLLLADDAALAGNWDSARQRYDGLAHEGVTQLLQPLLVAWSEQGAGRTDAALATLRPYLENSKFPGVYALHSALIADLAGRDAAAAPLYRSAQAAFAGGSNLRLAQIIASWQTRHGEAVAAEQTLEALDQGDNSLAIALPALVAHMNVRPVASATDGIAEAYLALAASLRQQDVPDFSMLMLDLALRMRPDFTPARLLMADMLDEQRHPRHALLALAPVPATAPLASVVQLRRAALKEEIGDTDQAVKQLEQLARDYPDRPEPLTQLGDILRAKSRFAEAINAYDRAIARIAHPGRSDWALFYARGVALDRDHEWSKAETDFEKALSLAPDQPYVLNYLGYSWAEQGRNLARAHELIERAVAQRPNDGAIIDSLGWVLLRQGDTKGATKWLERAVELEPEDATINGHLGDAYWAAGHKLQALYQWRRALNLNPEPEDVPKLQAKLREAMAADSVGPATADRQTR